MKKHDKETTSQKICHEMMMESVLHYEFGAVN